MIRIDAKGAPSGGNPHGGSGSFTLGPSTPYDYEHLYIRMPTRYRTRAMKTAQDLQFELMRLASFNEFDGNRVADDLLANSSLWSGALIDRFDLIKLRDLPNYWNVDTLHVLSTGRDDSALENLAQSWHADDVRWIDGEDALKLLGGGGRILTVWWD